MKWETGKEEFQECRQGSEERQEKVTEKRERAVEPMVGFVFGWVGKLKQIKTAEKEF